MVTELAAQNSIRSSFPEPRQAAPAAPEPVQQVAGVQQRQETAPTGQALPPASARDEAASPAQAELSAAVSNIQDHMQSIRRDLQFSVDEDSGETVVKVVDPETEEVIRQIPPKELLTLSQRLDEAAGLLIKAEA